jgi:hypothetical protein
MSMTLDTLELPNSTTRLDERESSAPDNVTGVFKRARVFGEKRSAVLLCPRCV